MKETCHSHQSLPHEEGGTGNHDSETFIGIKQRKVSLALAGDFDAHFGKLSASEAYLDRRALPAHHANNEDTLLQFFVENRLFLNSADF